MAARLSSVISLPTHWRVLASAGMFAVALGVASGCSSFGEATDGDDAGAANEAGEPAEAGDAGVGDGPPRGDAGPPGCLPPFCEDFETGTWGSLWNRSGTARLEVSTGAATSGERALELYLVSEPRTFLQRELGVLPSKVTVSVNVLVLERGDGEVDFVQISDGADNGAAKGVHFVHAQSTGLFSTESSASEPRDIAPTSEQSFATYARVSLEIDLNAHTYRAGAGIGQKSGALDRTWKPTKLVVSVGAPFANNLDTARPWRVRFDDLRVLVQP